jgi:hypothetical protein
MNISHPDFLVIVIGSVGSVASFLLCLSYPLIQNVQNKKVKRKDVKVTVDDKIINAQIPVRDLEKLLKVLRKYQPDVVNHSKIYIDSNA